MTRKAILVVGMHRSGTSAVARVLSLLGAALPRNLVGPGLGNELGHWEPEGVVQLHREMLADAGSATNSVVNFPPAWFQGPAAAAFAQRIASLLGDEYGVAPLFVMKEPRAALFVPTWIAALESLGIEPHFVIPFRDPHEVARSLSARQQAVFPRSVWPTSRGLALWQRYVLAAEGATRRHKRSFVAFEALLADWRSELARLARQLGLAWPRGVDAAAAEIDAFLNASHRHQASAAQDGTELPRAVSELYRALKAAVQDPGAQGEVFDRASAEAAAIDDLVGPYVARMEARLDDAAGVAAGRKMVYVFGAPGVPQHVQRVEHYAASARRRGYAVVAMPLEQAAARVAEIDGAEVVVIWRGIWGAATETVVGRARATGAKIVADVDEEIFRDAGHLGRLEKTILAADLCTVAGRSVGNHLRHFNKPLMLLPDGFDEASHTAAQLAAEARRRAARAGTRIGYLGDAGDFPRAAAALAGVLAKHRGSALLLAGDAQPLAEFDFVVLGSGSLGPLGEAVGAESYVRAALARVPLVAMTGGSAHLEITSGVTGLVASSYDEWVEQVGRLAGDPPLCRTLGENALHDVMARFGPERRDRALGRVVDYVLSAGEKAAETFRAHLQDQRRSDFVRPLTPPHEVVFESERTGAAAVAVIVPLYNYAHYVEEALESVRSQTLDPIDLVVVDDGSSDDSLAVARRWIELHQGRFNHAALLRNRENAKLGPTRNAAFTYTSARYVMALDADNVLKPACLERCLAALEASGAAAAFPILQQFGRSAGLVGGAAWQPARLACANYIDAMALIRKSAWAACGGYLRIFSREDYELWMKFVENGFWAVQVPEVLGLYRVHGASMIGTETPELVKKERLWETLSAAHPWIAVPPSP